MRIHRTTNRVPTYNVSSLSLSSHIFHLIKQLCLNTKKNNFHHQSVTFYSTQTHSSSVLLTLLVIYEPAHQFTANVHSSVCASNYLCTKTNINGKQLTNGSKCIAVQVVGNYASINYTEKKQTVAFCRLQLHKHTTECWQRE